jgi:hypothetical protein
MSGSDDNMIYISDNGKFNFNKANIKFREPRDLPSGGRLVTISYGEGKTGTQMLIQTPTLYAPMGKSVFDNPGAATKHSIMLSLRDMETTPDLQEFQKVLSDVDTTIRETGFDRCKSWFRKVYKTADTVNELYTPLERVSKNKDGEPDGKWPPNIKLNLPYARDGTPQFQTYNAAGEEIDIDSVDLKHANVRAIMVLQSVWIAGGNMFGVSLKAVQLMVDPPRKMNVCAFKGVKLCDKAALADTADKLASTTAALLLEDSDDEDQDQDDADELEQDVEAGDE